MQLFLLGLSRILRYAIATPDVAVGLLCHAAIASVYASIADVPEAAKMQTARAALCVCTLLQSGCYVFLGRLRASEVVQFVPYPVVCGLLGVTGIGICRAAARSGSRATTWASCTRAAARFRERGFARHRAAQPPAGHRIRSDR